MSSDFLWCDECRSYHSPTLHRSNTNDAVKLEEAVRIAQAENTLLWDVVHRLENRLKKIEDAGGVVVHSHIHINSASIEDEVRKALRKGALSSSLASTLLLDDVTPAITH